MPLSTAMLLPGIGVTGRHRPSAGDHHHSRHAGAGMSDFSDFKATIADWANRQDWSDILLTSFVRDAESKLNAELRIDRMI